MMRQEEQLLEAFLEQGGAGKEVTATSRRLHVATTPSHDVGVNKCRSQPFTTSRRHHVATSSRRDITTSRRQLKNLHLIIKCERAREFRVLKNVRPEIRNLRTCNTDFKHLLGFLYWFFFIVLIIFGSHENILHITYFVSFLHDVLSLFLGLHQTLSQTMD